MMIFCVIHSAELRVNSDISERRISPSSRQLNQISADNEVIRRKKWVDYLGRLARNEGSQNHGKGAWNMSYTENSKRHYQNNKRPVSGFQAGI